MGKHNKYLMYFNISDLIKFTTDENSCIEVVKQNYELAFHPFHLSDIKEAIKDILNKGIFKYNKRLEGVLMGYRNIKLLQSIGRINNDNNLIYLDIEADFFIFKPEVGQKLSGVVTKKSKDHVGCLVHKLFNVSLPKEENEIWLGNMVEIGQEILCLITFLNLDGRLPYIRASFISNQLEQDSGISTSEENLVEGSNSIKSQAICNTKIKFQNSLDPKEEIVYKKRKKKSSFTNVSNEEVLDVCNQQKQLKKKLAKHNDKQINKLIEIEEPEIVETKKKKKKKKHSHAEVLFDTTPLVFLKKYKHEKHIKEVNKSESKDISNGLLANEDIKTVEDNLFSDKVNESETDKVKKKKKKHSYTETSLDASNSYKFIKKNKRKKQCKENAKTEDEVTFHEILGNNEITLNKQEQSYLVNGVQELHGNTIKDLPERYIVDGIETNALCMSPNAVTKSKPHKKGKIIKEKLLNQGSTHETEDNMNFYKSFKRHDIKLNERNIEDKYSTISYKKNNVNSIVESNKNSNIESNYKIATKLKSPINYVFRDTKENENGGSKIKEQNNMSIMNCNKTIISEGLNEEINSRRIMQSCAMAQEDRKPSVGKRKRRSKHTDSLEDLTDSVLNKVLFDKEYNTKQEIDTTPSEVFLKKYEHEKHIKEVKKTENNDISNGLLANEDIQTVEDNLFSNTVNETEAGKIKKKKKKHSHTEVLLDATNAEKFIKKNKCKKQLKGVAETEDEVTFHEMLENNEIKLNKQEPSYGINGVQELHENTIKDLLERYIVDGIETNTCISPNAVTKSKSHKKGKIIKEKLSNQSSTHETDERNIGDKYSTISCKNNKHVNSIVDSNKNSNIELNYNIATKLKSRINYVFSDTVENENGGSKMKEQDNKIIMNCNKTIISEGLNEEINSRRRIQSCDMAHEDRMPSVGKRKWRSRHADSLEDLTDSVLSKVLFDKEYNTKHEIDASKKQKKGVNIRNGGKPNVDFNVGIFETNIPKKYTCSGKISLKAKSEGNLHDFMHQSLCVIGKKQKSKKSFNDVTDAVLQSVLHNAECDTGDTLADTITKHKSEEKTYFENKRKSTEKMCDEARVDLPDLNLSDLFSTELSTVPNYNSHDTIGSESAKLSKRRKSSAHISWSNKSLDLPFDPDLEDIFSEINTKYKKKHNRLQRTV